MRQIRSPTQNAASRFFPDVESGDFFFTSSPYCYEAYASELDEDAYAIMFPDAAFLAGCEMFENLPEETLALYDNLWTQLKS